MLKSNQYSVVDTDGDGEYETQIDFENHTLYVRARYVVTYRTDEGDIKVASDWSDVAACGKNGDFKTLLTTNDISAPKVSNFKNTNEKDSDGQPIFEFSLEVPKTLKKQEVYLESNSGYMFIEAEVRFAPDGDWTNVTLDSRNITSGKHIAYVGAAAAGKNIVGDTYVEMRCRYYISQYKNDVYVNDFYSSYSSILKVGTVDVKPNNPSGNGNDGKGDGDGSGSGDKIYSSTEINGAQNNNWVDADVDMVTQHIGSLLNDKDIKGSTFGKLRAKIAKYDKSSNTITWTKVKGATGYIIFGNHCGGKNKFEYMTTLGNVSKFVHKSLGKGQYYKYIVVAYKNVGGIKKTVAVSKTLHSTTTGGKYGNAKTVKLNKTKVTIKAKKSFKLKAKEVKKDKKIDKHRPIQFESSNEKVATVSAKGVITAKKKGKCTIYAYAQNGLYKAIKVTVK